MVKLTLVSEPDKGAHRAARTEGEAVRRLLEAHGFVTKLKNKEIVCPCPFHEGPGEVPLRKTSNFYVNSETGLWNCLSASCGERGNLRALEHHFNIGGDDEWVTALISREEQLKQYETNLNEAEYSDRRSVFYRQGLTDDTINRFRLGYDTDKERWVIPYLEGRKPKFFRYYQPNGDPKWKYTWEEGAHSCLYNEQDAIGDKEGITILTEGECFEGDAEVFTSRGWVRFDDLVDHAEGGNTDILVGQVTHAGEIEFVTPTAYVKKPYVGDIIEHYVPQSRLSPMMSHRSTPGHRIPGVFPQANTSDVLQHVTSPLIAGRELLFSDAKHGHQYDNIWPRAVILKGHGIQEFSSPDELLASFRTLIQEETPFPESWLMEAKYDERIIMLREAARLPVYSLTTTQQDWLVTLAHTTGCVAELLIDSYRSSYRSSIAVRYEEDRPTSWSDMKRNVYSFEGTVYCVTVPTEMLLVRIDGTISISGNCKTMLLAQLGWAAVGVPGAGQWKPEWHESFSDARQITIVFDNDNPLFHIYDKIEIGRRCPKCVSNGLPECSGHNPGQDAAAKRLKQLGWRAKNVVLPLPDDDTRKTDINEYFIRDGHTNAEFGELVTGRSASPFKVTSLSELHDSPPDEAVFLVEHGILPAGGRLLVSGRPKIGKAQPVSSQVLTPSGWRRMGTITPGSRVVGVDGRPTEVEAIHPQGVKPIYRVTMSDGSATYCTEEHLWTTMITSAISWETRILTTAEAKTLLREGKTVTIPVVAPIRYTDNGARLHDSYEVGRYNPGKTIHTSYLRAGIRERFALLQGLCDHSGWVTATGAVAFTVPTLILRNQCIELIEGLGGITSVQRQGTGWVITMILDVSKIRDHESPFRLPIKHRYWMSFQNKPLPIRTIRSIEYSHDEEAMCITVKNKDGLYVTERFIVTHNSIFVANLVLSLASGIPFLKSGAFPGFKVARPTRVLLLDRELSKYSLYSRLVSLIEHRPGYAAAAENLLLDHDHQIQLTSPDAYRTLEGLISHNGIEVLVIDPAYKVFGGDIESSKSVMKGFETLDRLIAKTGVSIILTHHHRKSQVSGGKDIVDADSIAGSFLWTGWPNASILLNFINRSIEDPFNSVCSFVAFRDAPPPEPVALYRGRDSISYRNIELYQDDVEFNSQEAVMALTTESIQQLLLDLCPVTEERFVHVAAAKMRVQVKTVKAFLVDAMSRGGFVKKGNPVTYYIDGTEKEEEDGDIKDIENLHFLFPGQREGEL